MPDGLPFCLQSHKTREMSIAAVGQFCATAAVHLNKQICKNLVYQASKHGAKVISM
jgi:hypothetical protein